MQKDIFLFHVINSDNKLGAFQQISRIIGNFLNIPHLEVFKSLLEREKIADTSLVNGICLPHAVLNATFSPLVFIFLDRKKIIDWKDLENKNIKILICYVLSISERKESPAITKIKLFSKKLANDQFIAKIGGCQNIDELKKIVLEK